VSVVNFYFIFPALRIADDAWWNMHSVNIMVSNLLLWKNCFRQMLSFCVA